MEISHFPIAPHSGASHSHIATYPRGVPELHSSWPRLLGEAPTLPQARPRPALRRPAPNPTAAHVTSAACDDLIPGVG